MQTHCTWWRFVTTISMSKQEKERVRYTLNDGIIQTSSLAIKFKLTKMPN